MLFLYKMAALITGFAALLGIGEAFAQTLEYDGLIVPYEVIDIGAPTDGIVAKVNVDRSSLVKQGQILVELESSVEQAAVEEARQKVAFLGDISMEQTKLAFAKRVYERIRPLTAISEHDKDKAATEIILTRYRLKKARQKHVLAEIELKKAQAMLDRHFVRSPISGVVVERYVSPGEYVSTQPLLQVAKIDPLFVEVIVPARMFGRITPGMTATVVPELEGYGRHTAKVTVVDRVVDSASSTFGVRLELPNPDHEIPSGLKCRVVFEADGAFSHTVKDHQL